MEFVWFLIAAILSTFVFDVLFQAFNQSMLKLFVPLQEKTNKLKKKSIYRNICLFIFILINTFIKDYFDLNYTWYGITFGFFLSLNHIIFPIERKKKQQSIESQ